MGETADRGKNDECESGGYHTNAPQHMWGAHRRLCGDRLRPRSQKVAHPAETGHVDDAFGSVIRHPFGAPLLVAADAQLSRATCGRFRCTSPHAPVHDTWR
jgi:hypothetical protein